MFCFFQNIGFLEPLPRNRVLTMKNFSTSTISFKLQSRWVYVKTIHNILYIHLRLWLNTVKTCFGVLLECAIYEEMYFLLLKFSQRWIFCPNPNYRPNWRLNQAFYPIWHDKRNRRKRQKADTKGTHEKSRQLPTPSRKITLLYRC